MYITASYHEYTNWIVNGNIRGIDGIKSIDLAKWKIEGKYIGNLKISLVFTALYHLPFFQANLNLDAEFPSGTMIGSHARCELLLCFFPETNMSPYVLSSMLMALEP